MSANNNEEEDESFYNLFVCRDYSVKTFTFPFNSSFVYTQQLLCLKSATTAHDLTGQIVWPACILLSWYILSQRTVGDSNHTIVVELGAGCGLSGFIASKFSECVYITDGSEEVINLLHRNQQFLQASNVTIQKLLWGKKSQVEALMSAISFRDYQGGARPVTVLGADVVLWPQMVLSLLHTVLLLLARCPRSSRCFISYVERATSTTALFFASAARMGLRLEEVSLSFLPSDEPSLRSSSTGQHLYLLTVDPRFFSQGDDHEVLLRCILHRPEASSLFEELQLSEAAMDTAFLPC